jgi:DNA-binding MarR family transcriptional regulator
MINAAKFGAKALDLTEADELAVRSGQEAEQNRIGKKGSALEMLEQTFSDIYLKFKIHFYKEIFKMTHARGMSLTSTEVFCVEIIHALGSPTVNEFASFLQVSSPNAAYKVNSLIKKGYIEKTQSEEDKREYHLRVTQKYYDYFNLSQTYLSEVTKRAEEHFNAEEIGKFDQMLGEISDKLMPEVNIPSVDLETANARTNTSKITEDE